MLLNTLMILEKSMNYRIYLIMMERFQKINFGYLQNKKFVTIDKGFKVSNGPAIDERKVTLYFSDSLNSSIYEYSLKNFKKKTLLKFTKNQGFPDGITLDNKNGLWVAHWGGGQVSRVNLKTKNKDKI